MCVIVHTAKGRNSKIRMFEGSFHFRAFLFRGFLKLYKQELWERKKKTYISSVTKKIVESKVIRESCAIETCRGINRKYYFTNKIRNEFV